jgi:hypothetical protein
MFVHAIIPEKLKPDAIRLALLTELGSIGGDIKKDFEKTTKTWKKKPKFVLIKGLKAGKIELLVYTDDPIYYFVDKGTKPHLIWAGAYTGKSEKTVLAFPGTFSAKTMPGVLSSFRGFSGGDPVFTPYVEHPGTKPRGFENMITKIWDKTYGFRMESAMARGTKESGHGI